MILGKDSVVFTDTNNLLQMFVCNNNVAQAIAGVADYYDSDSVAPLKMLKIRD